MESTTLCSSLTGWSATTTLSCEGQRSSRSGKSTALEGQRAEKKKKKPLSQRAQMAACITTAPSESPRRDHTTVDELRNLGKRKRAFLFPFPIDGVREHFSCAVLHAGCQALVRMEKGSPPLADSCSSWWHALSSHVSIRREECVVRKIDGA